MKASPKRPNLSENYIINSPEKDEFELKDPDNIGASAKNAIPLRLTVRGPFNLRGQSVENPYKIFLGEAIS